MQERAVANKYDDGDRPEKPHREASGEDGQADAERQERNELVRRIFDDVDRRVDNLQAREKIKEILFDALSKPGDATLGERLWDAYNNADQFRHNNSTDQIGQKVEYYILGLTAGVNDEKAMIFFTQVTGEAYDLAKTIAHGLRDIGLPQVEYALRADKSQPTSRPGDGPRMAREGFGASFGLDAGKPFRVYKDEAKKVEVAPKG